MYHLRAIVYICNLMVRVVSVVEFNIVIYQLQNYGVGFCSFEVPQSDRLQGKAERSSYRPGPRYRIKPELLFMNEKNNSKYNFYCKFNL